jgi:hypothetical protein
MSMGRHNQMMSQAGFAVDDFITVLQMPGMGLVPALRAASNNVSVLVGAIHPALVVIPSLATAALGLAMSMGGAAEETEELGNKTDETIGRLQRELELMRAIEGEKGRIKNRHAVENEMQPLRKRALELETQRREEMISYLGTTTYKGQPKRKAREGLGSLSTAHLEREVEQALKQELGGWAADRQFAEKFRTRLNALNKQRVEIGQEINLTQQKREEQEKKEAKQLQKEQVETQKEIEKNGRKANELLQKVVEGQAKPDLAALRPRPVARNG